MLGLKGSIRISYYSFKRERKTFFVDGVSDAWVSMSELALEWVTMDNTFINRAGVGGGWSHTYAHIQICGITTHEESDGSHAKWLSHHFRLSEHY